MEKKIYLPPEDFTYGLPNRPPTPFKDVICNAHGNKAEEEIRTEYKNFIRERSVKNTKPPKVVPRFYNPKIEEIKKREMEKQSGLLSNEDPYYTTTELNQKDKPLYKLKMFQDVGSKVAEEIKLFKTYHPYKKVVKQNDGVDYLINKVQGEIRENEKNNNLEPIQ